MIEWLELTLALVLWSESLKEVHLFVYFNVPSPFLMIAIACFEIENLNFRGYETGHEYFLYVVFFIESCTKQLLIMSVPGISRSEIKYVLRCSITWFANIRFSSTHPKLTSAPTIPLSLAHDDMGSINKRSHTSIRYRCKYSHR